jgi:hypothetical protein
MTGPQNYHKLRDCMTSNQYSQCKELLLNCPFKSFAPWSMAVALGDSSELLKKSH